MKTINLTVAPLRTRWRLLGLALLAGVLTALGGCANTLTTQVTNFNAWPANAAGGSFRVSTLPLAASAQWGELERKNYEQLIAQALQAQGLKPAAAGEQARFSATVRLDEKNETRTLSQAVYAPGWGYPAWGWSYGHYGYYGAYYGGWYAPPVYMGQRQYQQAVSIYLLGLRIQDRTQADAQQPQGQTVFESSAQYLGQPANLPALMPYLVQSLFVDFPGHNGQVSTVQLPIKP